MTVAVIPARGGSKRIPLKNMQKLKNMPLFQWSVNAALASSRFDAIILSSDSEQILNYPNDNRVIKHKRSAWAASDTATDRDVILDIAGEFKHKIDMRLIGYLRPTTPTRTLGSIELAIDFMKLTPGASGLRSVHEMSESAYKCFEMRPGDILKPVGNLIPNVDSANDPNQKYPKTFHPNGVIDVMRLEIVEAGGTFGESVKGFITRPVIEIDTIDDLKHLKAIITNDWD